MTQDKFTHKFNNPVFESEFKINLLLERLSKTLLQLDSELYIDWLNVSNQSKESIINIINAIHDAIELSNHTLESL